MKRMHKLKGFSLIEVLVAVAIVGILSAVALPAYSTYVTRGRLAEAFTALGGAQPAAEQWWANNRKYTDFDTASNFPKTTANFSYALSNATASSYTITATGLGKVAGFVFTVDQNGARATTASPSGWGTSTSCWVDRKGGACTN